MPKLKVGNDELDLAALEAAEYDESGDFDDYEGPRPPKKTILAGYVKTMYWTLDASDERMLKSLFIAAENTGDKAKYNGCPIWDNTSLKTSTKFRWVPLLRALGFNLRDIKTKLHVLPEENDHATYGAVIEKIGTFAPGEENETAWCRVLTGTHPYNGDTLVDVGKWLPWADAEPDEDEDEPEEDETEDEDAADEEVDEDEPEEDEAEEEPEPPARARKLATRTAAKPAATKPAPARTATRAAKPAAGKPVRGRPTRGSTDDTPF